MNLKLAVFWIRYQNRTSRPFAIGALTVDAARSMRRLRDHEQEHKNPSVADYPKVDSRNWSKTFGTLRELFLTRIYGVTNIPLASVIRKNVAPARRMPHFYANESLELIDRAPHTSEAYPADNRLLWTVFLYEITRNEDCYTYIKSARKEQDGRAAFFMLYNHFLGENNVTLMASEAEKKLQTLMYSGEKRRFTFEKFVRAHTEQHTILEGLVDHVRSESSH